MSNKYGKIFKLPSYHENANKNKQWRNTKYWQRCWEVETLGHCWSIIGEIILKSNSAISGKIEDQTDFSRN